MKLLFITLTNIGDCILTLPALDELRQALPSACVSVICSERAKELFENNPHIENVIVYDKRAPIGEQARLFLRLARSRFDIIVDLRNTFMSFLLPARHKIPLFLNIPKFLTHKKDVHIFKARAALSGIKIKKHAGRKETTLFIPPREKKHIKEILFKNNINFSDRVVVVAPGARSHVKRWTKDKFIEVLNVLAGNHAVKIILVGDKDDEAVSGYIEKNCRYPLLNLTGQTTLLGLARVLSVATVLIANDSAILHLASYLNIPVVAVFGPTDDTKYSPWADNFRVVKKEIFCRPCAKAQCRFGTLECMQVIRPQDVLNKVRGILGPAAGSSRHSGHSEFKRILIVRTDRVGDVLLSTPAIKALRDAYPDAYIAMMVSPYAKDIVEGNPYLDRVIVYDKDAKHKSWQRTFRFSRKLSKLKFDVALVLHPTNRAHIVSFLAGIPRRIGYNRKMGFLLTLRILHTKHLGEKHESEYNLDLLKCIGVNSKAGDLYMPISEASQEWTDILFREEGIRNSDMLLAIHPGASCPSKIWPNIRFAEAADVLSKKYGFKVLLVSGAKDKHLADQVAKHMHVPVINLAGRTSLGQLASILKRCRLFISNDSGPVHIATAVGTPVISIFGRNQKGLGPKRWGPCGKYDKYLHKEVGCIECLAHRCNKEFLCLKAIEVEDVVSAADSILKFKLI